MRVLVACEFSGVVRDSFIRAGHEATSCDLMPSLSSCGPHYQGDVRDLLVPDTWDLLIAHPPCTYLCSSGLHWNRRIPERAEKTEEAVRFVCLLLDAPVPRIAVENPVGCLSTRIRPPDQIIQPHAFGEDASKATCLWLRNLPPLVPTKHVPPSRIINGKPRRANQTDSGQNRLAPSPDRWMRRSVTFKGIGDAMAAQWGILEPSMEQSCT